jgi:phosphoribosylformylglycinamidine cyclo-ligase
VHCSGGGQTKCLRFGSGVRFIKDNLFSPPPIFQEIKAVSGTTDEEMHQVYNMGHRLEIFCKPEHADKVIEISANFNIEAKTIGWTEQTMSENGKNQLEIRSENKTLKYG